MAVTYWTHHRDWSRAMLSGEAAPGVHVLDGPAPYTLVIPSRIPPWVRTPAGHLWHRVRWSAYAFSHHLSGGVLWHPDPRVWGATWCGQQAMTKDGRDPARRWPTYRYDDPPDHALCQRCGARPPLPDPRSYPDRRPS